MKTALLLLCISFSSFFHVGHIAEYRYQRKDNTVYLRFTIEKQELLDFKLSKNCDVKQLTAFCTAKYLNQKTVLKINGVALAFEFIKSYTHKDHLIIEMKSKINSTSIQNIHLTNTSFYEFNSKFRNRVLLDIAPFKKSYLLTKNTSSIHLK
ncbi:MAG: hypothetical protein JKY44_04460 [Flavobacteriaceae bacterium]|nr:hypothetical protein [Flavobacteriaceae bacterium]